MGHDEAGGQGLALKRTPYTASAPRGQGQMRSGFKIKKFRGLVTGMDKSNIPQDAASSMLDLDCENGQLSVRPGYRSVGAKDSVQSTMKGAFFCQTYVSATVKESLVAMRYDVASSGILSPYEFEYNSTTDAWSWTEIKNGASSVTLNNSYWRSFCFHDLAYFLNPADTNAVYTYSLTTHNTFTPYRPPADPAAPPTISYYRSTTPDYAYKKYFGAAASYATSDFTVDNAVLTTATKFVVGERIGANIVSSGSWSIAANLVHGGTNTDCSNNDVYTVTLEVDDVTKATVDFDNITAVATNGTPTNQTLVVSVVSKDIDSVGRVKSAVLYLKFAGKTRSTWSTMVSVTLSGTAVYSAATPFYVSPLTAGGIVDWGGAEVKWRIAYSRYESSTGLESGLSLAPNVDNAKLYGAFVDGNPKFPLGSIPVITMTGASDSDNLRLYSQAIELGQKDKFSWGRIVTQSDGTLTYTWNTTYADWAALTKYAPAPFDFTNLVNGGTFKQWGVTIYSGGSKNVRHSRWGTALAQASLDDAFNTDIAQDDPLRGANFTLNNDRLDEPIGLVQLGNCLVILAKGGIYVQFDTNGLPSGMTPPELVAGAPGCKGADAFCRWHDASGEPIVVYVDSRGDQLWAVRIPRGYTPGQPLAQAAWEFGSLVRNGFASYLYGDSVLRSDESLIVYVNERDDSLHLRYNVRELKLGRPDIVDGERQWVAYQFGLGQYGSQWGKVVSFRSSAYGYGVFGFRLNGAVDEFFQANMKYPTSTDRYYVDILGQGSTPASLTSSVVTFTIPHGWSSGTPVVPTTTANGLTAGTTYYYGRVTYLTGSLYDTQAHAQAGGATGRVTLTGTSSWDAGALTPLGRDDGAAIANSIHWTSYSATGLRRRPHRAHVQKSTMTDVFTCVCADDFGNSKTATVRSGAFHGPFSPGLAAFALTHKIVFLEGNDPVSAYWTEEETLDPRRAF